MTNPEARTRTELIDPKLLKAGWDVRDSLRVRTEIPVDGYEAEPWNGVTDYILLRENGEILAVVEAKKTTHDPRFAETQLRKYVNEIAKRQKFRPFGFTTNGRSIYFFGVDGENKHEVVGFFTREDLERLLAIRNDKKALADVSINQAIINRTYQMEAVRRVGEAFEVQNKRRALLVMATGTGKTRTSMAIIDVFMRANQARRILFVADRDALVDQAQTDGFEKHIPSEPAIRIHTYNLAEINTSRLFVVTLQTLSLCYKELSPAFFDLIIFDEVHRSIFNKYADVLDYFDARIIGLTATPAQFVDRDTFVKFDCATEDPPIPTFLYTYEEAIEDGVLVDYRLYRAKTGFQEDGIRGAFLTEVEQNLLIEQGHEPDDIDFEGSDLEKTVTNKDTLRKQWQEFMDVSLKDRAGELPGKTIVFAMTQDHAQRLVDTFEEMYPQYPGMARVITSKSDFHRTLIKEFKNEKMPRIAVSVDMLETGVDVPEVLNLVFMRPIQSSIKMQQMIGRGTRNNEACEARKNPSWLPEDGKSGFLIMDFLQNDFTKQADDAPAQNESVLVSLFRTRLKLLERDLRNQQTPEFKQLVAVLRGMITRIPLDTYSVQRVLVQVEEAWKDDFWQYLTPTKMTLLKNHVAPLLRYAPGMDVEAETFTHKVERLKLQIAEGKTPTAIADTIREDVSRLPGNFYEHFPQREAAVRLVLSQELERATPSQLAEVIDHLAAQMKNRSSRMNPILELDLRDYMASRGFIVLKKTGEEIYVQEYQRRVEEHILALIINHPTILAIQNGQSVSDEQLIEVERTLRQKLADGSLELTDTNMRRAYGTSTSSLLSLIRRILDLDTSILPDYRDIAGRQFDHFVAQHETEYNANQLRFLRALKEVLLKKRHIERNDLYEFPFTSFGDEAVERWFTDTDIQQILDFAAKIAA